MSGFLGITQSGPNNILKLVFHSGMNSDVIQPNDYRMTLWPDGLEGTTQMLSFEWPRASLLGADFANIAPIWDPTPLLWEWNTLISGQHTRKKLSGIVRDSAGNPIAGATVQIFNTATGLLVDTVTTDSSGAYNASDPNAVNCFAVGYEAGAPDVAGTTVNTITGT